MNKHTDSTLFSVTNYDSPHCLHGELDQLISFAHSPEEELLPVVSNRSPLQSLCVSSLLKTGGQQEEMNARVKLLDRPTQTSQTQRRNKLRWENKKKAFCHTKWGMISEAKTNTA